jgi:lipopolysaccharide export system permease protein
VTIPVLVGAFLMLRQGIRGQRTGRLRPAAG